MYHPVRDVLRNYFVTIHSDGGPRSGRNGKASNFVVTLPEPLKFPNRFYNVGLMEFRCFKKPEGSESFKVEQLPSPQGLTQTLFTQENPIPDPQVYVWIYSTAIARELGDFFRVFNTQMQRQGAPIKILGAAMSYGKDGKLRDEDEILIHATVTGLTDQEYIQLPREFAMAFGLKRDRLYNGLSSSSRIRYSNVPMTLKLGTSYTFSKVNMGNGVNKSSEDFPLSFPLHYTKPYIKNSQISRVSFTRPSWPKT